MKRFQAATLGIGALGIALATLLFSHQSISQTIKNGGQPKSVSTGLDDQEAVSVTVYNSDLGLIKDLRQVTLPAGVVELRFGDVAAKIMPQTVHIKTLKSQSQLQVLEQNYEYDLLTPEKLLEKFTGKEIAVLKDGVEIPMTILSTNQGLVYRLGGRIYTGH